jgi:hypothetical protein
LPHWSTCWSGRIVCWKTRYRRGIGVSNEFGEEYSEYYAIFLGTVARVADLRDDRTLGILAAGSYCCETERARFLPFGGKPGANDWAVGRRKLACVVGGAEPHVVGMAAETCDCTDAAMHPNVRCKHVMTVALAVLDPAVLDGYFHSIFHGQPVRLAFGFCKCLCCNPLGP